MRPVTPVACAAFVGAELAFEPFTSWRCAVSERAKRPADPGSDLLPFFSIILCRIPYRIAYRIEFGKQQLCAIFVEHLLIMYTFPFFCIQQCDLKSSVLS